VLVGFSSAISTAQTVMYGFSVPLAIADCGLRFFEEVRVLLSKLDVAETLCEAQSAPRQPKEIRGTVYLRASCFRSATLESLQSVELSC
jgi:hypothetical protein